MSVSNRRFFIFGFLVCVPLLFGLTAGRASAETDYLREFAKNKTRLLIVASGAEALPLAEELESTVKKNGDFAGKDPNNVRVVPLGEAEPLLNGDFARASVVFFLSGTDGVTPDGMPQAAAGRLPIPTSLLGGKRSAVKSVPDSDRPGEPVFRVGMYAPDAARLGLLYRRFTAQRAGNFRDLPFSAQFVSNRLAVFAAPENREVLAASGGRAPWGTYDGNRDGAQVWDDVDVYGLSERDGLPAPALNERTEVYFINRAKDTAIPDAARRVLAGTPVRRNQTVTIYKPGDAEHNPVYVVSAPTRSLLISQIRRCRLTDDLADAAGKGPKEFTDLSGVREASLLIVGGPNLTPDLADTLHVELSRKLRTDYGIAIEPRGSVLTALENDLALQMARGATDTRGFLRRRFPTRYAWVFTVTQATGGMTYEAGERKVTPDPRPFDEYEPVEPRQRRDESDSDFDRRWRKWRADWRSWDQDRRRYEDAVRTAPCEWELSITRDSKAEVRGLLQLIDQQGANGPAFVWEKECAFQAGKQDVVRTQRVTVRGHENRPDSLTPPPASSVCPPALLLAAAQQAGEKALAALPNETLLPNEIEPDPDAPAPRPLSAAPQTAPRPLNPPAGPKVADKDGQTIVLNVGSRHGIKVGDRFEVLIAYKETTDPDTGKVIRLRVQESLIVVVTSVDDEACDTRPMTPADNGKLGKVKTGMRVRRSSGQ